MKNKQKGSEYMNFQNAEDKRKKVRRMFNRIAGRYDFLNHFLSLGIDNIWRRVCINKMNIEPGSRILDLATGTGDLAIMAMKKNPRFIAGLDPAREMMKGALRKKKLAGKYYAVEAYGESIPFADHTFSHAMIAYGIRNVSDRAAVFREVSRVLDGGEGVFAVLEFSRSRYRLFSAAFDLYFKKILTFIGGMVSGDKDAYRYLPESVENFPSPEEFIREAEENGFMLSQKKEMFFGITTLYMFRVGTVFL